MKEKYLRIIIYTIGILCLYVFLAIRSFPLMNAVLSEKMDNETRDFSKYGELYYFSCISDFKIPFPEHYHKYRLSDRNPQITQADILTYGDSFFDLSFQKNIPELLSDTLDKKVFSFVSRDPTRSNPFCILNQSTYQYNSAPKKFIYESVERNIPEKFGEEFNISCLNNQPAKESVYDQVKKFIFKKNSENLYDVVLKHSILTSKVYSWISTAKFKLFGYISPLTAKYTTQPEPWLFHEKEYGNEPGGFYYEYTDEEISTYADNILHLKNSLKTQYNLDLIFLPIPTKYTIYHRLINDHQYNNFLPRLYTKLEERNINYIDLYNEFRKSDETLYHGTDTHWNYKGVDITVGLLLQSMESDDSNQIARFNYDPEKPITQ